MLNLFTYILIISFFISGCSEDMIPSDAQLEARFIKNKTVYEEVFSDVQNNLGISRISLGKSEVTVFGRDLNLITKEKYQKYFNLGKLPSVIEIDYGERGEIARIDFLEYRNGLLSKGDIKGVSFLRYSPPADHLLQNLDGYGVRNRSVGVNERIYKSIGNGWYIFYEQLN